MNIMTGEQFSPWSNSRKWVFNWLEGALCGEELKRTWIISYCIAFPFKLEPWGWVLISIPGLRWAFPCSTIVLLEGWSCSTIGKKAKKLWMAVPLCLFWAFWRERNIIVFDDELFSMTRLKTSFISMFVSWASCLELGECYLVRILLCIL